MEHPLYVAIVWHMHQPLYRDPSTGMYSLPWVRLHATKDYLHMAELLQEYPAVHVTFNLVPCLLEQLEAYARGEAVDKCLQLSRQESWSLEERQFMLSFFFHINWNKIIQKYPPYARLLQLRQAAPDRPELFSDQYFRDLIAWFNLAWMDPNWLEKDPLLAALVAKGENFTVQDIQSILDKQMEIIRLVLPTYRQLMKRGQIEISTSPYYHPILPLVIDSSTARRASPNLLLPTPAFAHPEDAEEHIRRAVKAHHAFFGSRPMGMWPSEGAVCPEMIEMVIRHGFRWLASDEAILERSLGIRIARDGHGHVLNPHVLYQPYWAASMPGAPAILFRDHVLSDRIGFVYQHMDGHDAADDLFWRLYVIREKLGDLRKPYLVSIILDGENCWEEYEHNGDTFLRRLYSRLASEEAFQAVTVSEYLRQFPPQETIKELATGSWIGGHLETWIGEPAQNRAWEYLGCVRDHLVAWKLKNPLTDLKTLERAWEAIYVAEGSDWFWWYYSRNNPASEGLFDQQFRRHLSHVYRSLGLPVPGWLKMPIEVKPEKLPRWHAPQELIHPPLNAAEPAPPEWEKAGCIEATPAGGTMQRADPILQRVYFGNDESSLFLRLESPQSLSGHPVSVYLSLWHGAKSNQFPRHSEHNLHLEPIPIGLDWEIRISEKDVELYRSDGQESWLPAGPLTRVARTSRVQEIAIPLEALNLELAKPVGMLVVVYQDDAVLETLPPSGYISFMLLKPSTQS